MKTKIHLILTLGFLLAFAHCNHDSDDGLSTGEMVPALTIPGGCNNMNFGNLKGLLAEETDTVLFSARKDTLEMFAGINYICCAPFNTTALFRNDSLIVTLTDVCDYPAKNCYCRCMCYYTWQFLFTEFRPDIPYGYRVVLDDPRQKEASVIMEGRVRL